MIYVILRLQSKRIRQLNNRLVSFERAFLAARGIYDDRAETRHVIFGSSIHNSYGSSMFPGIGDALDYW
jgi:N-acetylated-alpha-linked acidic dipeptidase